MKGKKWRALFYSLSAASLLSALRLHAQHPFRERFLEHNKSMTALQPSLITPLVAPDPRIVQYVKFSFANQYTQAGTQTVNFGNGRGMGLIGGNRFEFDFIPPPYIEHNSSAMDGFGDTATLAKCRVASGNAQHGNYELTAILGHTFATGSYKNGAPTDSYSPAVAAAKAFRHVDFIGSLGSTLPTGKIAPQGRSVSWNSVVQYHAERALWFEVENNAVFYFAGSHDGQMQNFVTPVVFYVARPKDWAPAHPFFIFNAGMQIATSHFHTYNHNVISEMRILF